MKILLHKKCIEIWKHAVLENKNVIVSDTNLKQKYNNEWRPQEQLMRVLSYEENIVHNYTRKSIVKRFEKSGCMESVEELLIHNINCGYKYETKNISS